MSDFQADLKRVEEDSNTRYQEIRQRFHKVFNDLQAHELKIAASELDRTALRALLDALHEKIDELDDIIRGRGPDRKGLIEMIGETARNIADIKDSQDRVSRQRYEDDKANKESLNQIQSDVTALTSEKAERKGGYTVIEKIVGIALLLMSFASMGAALGWWGVHH